MNILLFLFAVVGWTLAIIAIIAFSVVSTALMATQYDMFEKMNDDKHLRD